MLTTPPGTSEYTMYRDEAADPPVIVCQVGGTKLLTTPRHRRPARDAEGARRLDGARRRRRAEAGARGRSRRGALGVEPGGGWYGLKKGLRGRFGVYLPPLLEALGLAEVTHDAKNNRMRAIG